MKLFFLLLLQISWVSAGMLIEDYNFTKHCLIDLVFVLDESGSISDSEFQQQLHFVHGIVEHFVIGPAATQVAVILFNHTAESQFFLNTYGTGQKADLLTHISGIQNRGIYTAIHTGLELARTESLNTSNGARHDSNPEVKEVVVLLTDGHSNQTKAKEEAEKLHDDDVLVIAIGIGDNTNHALLKDVATGPGDDNVFHVDFDTLDSIAGTIITIACNNCSKWGPDWKASPVTNSCYLFVEKELSCRRARKYCKEKAAKHTTVTVPDGYPMLVRIENEAENAWLSQTINNLPGGDRYIGMTLRRWKNPIEMWNDCPNDYAHWTCWAPNEPNNHKGNNEKCVQMIWKGPWAGYWNDVPPSNTMKFICEIPMIEDAPCSGTDSVANSYGLNVNDVCLITYGDGSCYWDWLTLYYLGLAPDEFTCLNPCDGQFRMYL